MISNYMTDDSMRHLLNELTQKVFGFDFEGWVTKGYFEGDYIPYSLVQDGKMISNVSANRMRFWQNGSEKTYIQIGTVMTDPDHRNRGLAAKLMRHVIAEYEQGCDGIYLFGDLGAVNFYQKMGFSVLHQYRYFVKDEFCRLEKGADAFTPLTDPDDSLKEKYKDYVRNSAQHSAFEQINKYGLQMFYTAELDNVFYCGDLDCFIVLEQEEMPVLQSVLCRKKIALTDVLKHIAFEKPECRLGFTPLPEDGEICFSECYDGGEDYRLFYRGKELESIERDRLYFPDLSHA